MTDENATSTIEFGTSSTVYTRTVSSLISTTTQSITLTELYPEVLYYFRILAWDTAGNLTTSPEYTLTTRSLPPSAALADTSGSFQGPTGGSSGGSSSSFSEPVVQESVVQKNQGQESATTNTNVTNIVNPTTPINVPVISAVTKNLHIATRGPEVFSLQKFLNEKGFAVSVSGAGSPGKETTYFGPATRAALIRFQKANNIRPALGYFGPITRAAIEKMQ